MFACMCALVFISILLHASSRVYEASLQVNNIVDSPVNGHRRRPQSRAVDEPRRSFHDHVCEIGKTVCTAEKAGQTPGRMHDRCAY
jgi:hypothetical protein